MSERKTKRSRVYLHTARRAGHRNKQRDAVKEKMTELELVICEASLRLRLRLKLSFCPLLQTGQKAGEVDVPSQSLSFSLTARRSDSKAPALSTASFLSTKTLRKLLVLFIYLCTGMAILHIYNKRRLIATQKSYKTLY